MSRDFTRRHFLSTASAGAAALGIGGKFAHAAADTNERIAIGMIGVGGRGSMLMDDIHKVATEHNAEIVAICDVYKPNAMKAAARAKEWFGKDAQVFSRFGDLLALKNVDAVAIATPDFAHTPIMIEALKAGKDVYCEKPMSITVEEANEALDLARKHERVVQVGTQRRSEGGYKAAAKEFATGVLGKVSRVTGTCNFNHARWTRDCSGIRESDVDWDAYLFNREKRPFDPKLLGQWQLYKMCTNGLAGLWMTHFSDVLHMITRAKFPHSAVAHGGIYVWKDDREHTDTFTALLEYPDGFLMDWSMNLAVAEWGVQFNVWGDKGVMDVEKLTLTTFEGRKGTTRKIAREANESHMGNWLSCIRTRQRPNADIEYGHQHSVATILSATALNSGRRQVFDPKTRQIREG